MSERAVITVSRRLPLEMRQRLLRCALRALRRGGATNFGLEITTTDLIVEAEVPQ
jgi:hypothetical protein